MRHKIILSILTGICVTLQLLNCACDRVDHNGKLYGQWQLMEWKDTQGQMKGDKNTGLFYNVNLELLYMQHKNYVDNQTRATDEIRCTFCHRADSLLITGVYIPKANTDTEVTDQQTKEYHLRNHGAGNGRMRIITLSNSCLSLINSDQDTLTFRKF